MVSIRSWNVEETSRQEVKNFTPKKTVMHEVLLSLCGDGDNLFFSQKVLTVIINSYSCHCLHFMPLWTKTKVLLLLLNVTNLQHSCMLELIDLTTENESSLFTVIITVLPTSNTF